MDNGQEQRLKDTLERVRADLQMLNVAVGTMRAELEQEQVEPQAISSLQVVSMCLGHIRQSIDKALKTEYTQ